MNANSTVVPSFDPNVPYPVADIIISSYAHPIIFALSLGSIFWGGICALIVSHLNNSTQTLRLPFQGSGSV
jgi:hypothetical protein